MAFPSPLALIQSVPPVTRVFTALTLVSSAVYGSLWWRNLGLEATLYMTLVPGAALYSPWTLVTSSFVETTVFEVGGHCMPVRFSSYLSQFIASLIFVPAALKYLERLWGSVEVAKFIAVVVVTSNILAFALNWLEFIVLRNADLFLYEFSSVPNEGKMLKPIPQVRHALPWSNGVASCPVGGIHATYS
jgi:hypothetical protein